MTLQTGLDEGQVNLRGATHVVTVALASWSAISSARAESVVVTASRDATLIQWSSDGPLLANGLGDIYVGRTNQDGQEPATISIRRGLVFFDLEGVVPLGRKVAQATLVMRDVRGLNGDPLVTLHRAGRDWSEGTSFFQGGQGAPATDGDATWLHSRYNAANPAASDFWDTPGGDFELTASAEATVSDDLGGGQFFSWSSDGLLQDLRSWITAPATNFGWLIRGDESRGQSAKRLNSHESTDAPNQPPQLLLELTPVLAGDYNDDGVVDAADYTVWRDATGPLANETETVGEVTPEDDVVWRSQYGAIGPSSAVIPEPIAATIITSLLTGVLSTAIRIRS